MVSFISLINESELHKEFSRDIRDRRLDQKFLYTDPESADTYYDLHHSHKSGIKKSFSNDDYYTFLKKNLGNTKQKIGVISLGCGNAEKEKEALAKLSLDGWELIYIGVDSSMRMLELAQENLKDAPYERKFIQTDFIDDSFKDEIVELTKQCDRKLFAFLGNTLGNVNQTNIADILYNSLDVNDLLWLDVVARNDVSMENEMKTFNRYSSYLTDEKIKYFFFHPLSKLNIPFDSGDLMMRASKETSVGAMLFIFYFHFNKKIVSTIDNEKIHFLPGEEIGLQKIRVYHPETMITFFTEHEFALLDSTQKGNKGQFIFTKSTNK